MVAAIIIIPILQTEKLRHKELKWLAQETEDLGPSRQPSFRPCVLHRHAQLLLDMNWIHWGFILLTSYLVHISYFFFKPGKNFFSRDTILFSLGDIIKYVNRTRNFACGLWADCILETLQVPALENSALRPSFQKCILFSWWEIAITWFYTVKSYRPYDIWCMVR